MMLCEGTNKNNNDTYFHTIPMFSRLLYLTKASPLADKVWSGKAIAKMKELVK